jgi:hypothetical protein
MSLPVIFFLVRWRHVQLYARYETKYGRGGNQPHMTVRNMFCPIDHDVK